MHQATRPRIALTVRALACAATLACAQAGATVVHFPSGTSYTPIYSPASLVVNGDFNFDPLVDPDHPTQANPHITGWTVSPQGEFTGTRNSNAGVGADGRGLRLGDLSLIDVSQSLKTVVGQSYQLSFFLAVEDTDVGNLFRVYAGDTLLANLDNRPYASNDEGWFWQYIYDFAATSTATTLDFQYQSLKSDQYLSNVSVLAVPEPSTWALLLVGGSAAAAAAGLRNRRRTELRLGAGA